MKCKSSTELKEVVNDVKTTMDLVIIRLDEIENKVDRAQNEINLIKKVTVGVITIIAGLLGFQIQF